MDAAISETRQKHVQTGRTTTYENKKGVPVKDSSRSQTKYNAVELVIEQYCFGAI